MLMEMGDQGKELFVYNHKHGSLSASRYMRHEARLHTKDKEQPDKYISN